MRGIARAKSFHESYSPGAGVKPPSDRSTGFVFAVVFALVAVWWRNAPIVPWVALATAGILTSLGLLAPWVLRPLNRTWFRIGLLMHRVVNPIVMLIVFLVVFLPAGLLMRIWADPLRARRAAPGASYWIDRAPAAQGHGAQGAQGAQGAMTNQF